MNTTDLLRRLAECHRTTSEPFWDAAVPGLFLVKCPACDGNRSHVWEPGDEPYSCELWREAVASGVVVA